jgi:aspartyl-tRNA(Asn)/glutamyl-tRNA(Gln) amidotransferase subunit C
MQITKELLDKIAHLARLEYDEKDSAKMMEDMSAIVSWIEKLNEINTEGVEPLTSMSQEINSLREDIPSEPMKVDDALKNAPEKDSNYFRVPKFLD